MNTADRRKLGKQALSCALVIGIWFAPVPAGLTKEAWHLFAVFAGAIFSVIVNAFPLLTASLLAVGTVVLTGTVDPAKAFAGFANASVLLVIVAFLVANAVVKSGLGRRISRTCSKRMRTVHSRAGLQHLPHRCLDRAGVSEQYGARRRALPDHSFTRPERRLQTRRCRQAPSGRLSHVLVGWRALSVSSALWLTATSANPIGVSLAAQYGVKIDFGTWLLAASVPALATILLLPPILAWLFPPGVTAMPDAPALARQELHSMGPLSRDEWIVAVTFAVMVTGWVMADSLHLSLTAVAFAGLGVLLATNVLTLEDINLQGGTLVTFLWLAVLFAPSGQLNELGFMGYVGGRLTAVLGGIAWPIAYVVLLVLYVLMHYMFVSQSAQVLALFAVFLDVAVRTGVPASLMAFALLFASSYFSTITPQGRNLQRHLRRQQLPDAGRTLPARSADHGILVTHVPGVGERPAAFRRTVTPGHRSWCPVWQADRGSAHLTVHSAPMVGARLWPAGGSGQRALYSDPRKHQGELYVELDLHCSFEAPRASCLPCSVSRLTCLSSSPTATAKIFSSRSNVRTPSPDENIARLNETSCEAFPRGIGRPARQVAPSTR